MRFLPRRMLSTIAEATPGATVVEALIQRIPGRTDDEHVRTREFHLVALRFRAEHSLAGLARRLKRAIDAGEDSYTAFVEYQDQAVAAAGAHVEWLVLDRFYEAAGRVATRISARCWPG